jgi:hypothetical protein
MPSHVTHACLHALPLTASLISKKLMKRKIMKLLIMYFSVVLYFLLIRYNHYLQRLKAYEGNLHKRILETLVEKKTISCRERIHKLKPLEIDQKGQITEERTGNWKTENVHISYKRIYWK